MVVESAGRPFGAPLTSPPLSPLTPLVNVTVLLTVSPSVVGVAVDTCPVAVVVNRVASNPSSRNPTPRVIAGRPILGYDYAFPDSADTHPYLVVGRVNSHSSVHRHCEVAVNRRACFEQWPDNIVASEPCLGRGSG